MTGDKAPLAAGDGDRVWQCPCFKYWCGVCAALPVVLSRATCPTGVLIKWKRE